LGEALKPEFRDYAAQIIRNSKHLAQFLMDRGVKLVTNGTDNHMMLINCIESWQTSGQEIERTLDKVGITLNKNMVPDDTRSPMDPSGIRIGTPAVTTRGMREKDMETLAAFMLEAIEKRGDEAALQTLREEVRGFCRKFPVPGI